MNIYTVERLADEAGVTARYIRQLIEEGRIKAEKYAGAWLISEEEAKRYLADRQKNK